jgi:phosphoribosylamine--glycine ligase
VKVLIVGSGGREHALAWKLKVDDPALEIVATPGNAGIAELGRCVRTNAVNIAEVMELAAAERADVTLIGPEGPLAAGLADRLIERRLPAFGPTAAAAAIESSKAFAKSLMATAGVPTAMARAFSDSRSAKSFAHELGAPVVVKASGLAAGKGVIVCSTLPEADDAVDRMLEFRELGEAGAEILIEEFMSGEELSVLVITDGTRYHEFLPARDHKRLSDGDSGPNTGGMGAYAPVRTATPEVMQTVRARIIEPTLAALRERGTPFRGVLYAGLMLTRDGPKVVEFNCRLGDPETQAILPLLHSHLLRWILPVAQGNELPETPFVWEPRSAVTTVVAAAGYPGRARVGDPIQLPAPRDDTIVFHAGTARDNAGQLVSAGGRVLSVTSVADTVEQAAALSRSTAEQIQLEGKQLRRDIAARESFTTTETEPRIRTDIWTAGGVGTA